uniref:hypothetical protein n=1 Tax=uncultured Thiodictyon sp. TaxID=1846217 RepID=UPI0025D0886D
MQASSLLPILATVMAFALAIAAPGVPAQDSADTAIPADRLWSDEQALRISGASLEPYTRRLIITGQKFGSRRPPRVSLDGVVLSLSSAGEDRLVTDPLPANLVGSGTHALAVIDGSDRTRLALYQLVIDSLPTGGGRSAAPQANRISVIDHNGDVGVASSIAVGATGNPLILYLDYANRDLKLARCRDAACTGADLQALATDGDVGWANALIVGADGLPRLSYVDNTNKVVKFGWCEDPECRVFKTRTIDTAGQDGQHTSIILGRDGWPVISYYDNAQKHLKVAHCLDPHCEMFERSTVDDVGNVGWYTSMALGADGNPVISYFDATRR